MANGFCHNVGTSRSPLADVAFHEASPCDWIIKQLLQNHL